MAESSVTVEQDTRPLSRGRDAVFGAGKVLGKLIKWMIYGWAARIALGFWVVAAFLPAYLAFLAFGVTGTSMILSIVVGLFVFVLVGAGIDSWTDFTDSPEVTTE